MRAESPLARWDKGHRPLTAAGIALGSVLLWLPALDRPIHVDAACYATAAFWWARGDTLYANFTIDRPQGIFVAFRLIEAAGLDSTRGIHLAAALCSALCALLLLAVAGRIWGRAVGVGSAALFALLMATPTLEGPTANAELFMLPPLLSSLYLLLRAEAYPLGAGRGELFLAGSGLCGALALLLKPSGGTVVAFAALWVLRRWRVDRAPWGALGRAGAALGAGFLLGLAPALAHGLLTVPQDYLYVVFLYRLTKQSAASGRAGDQVFRFLATAGLLVVSLPLLLAAAQGLREVGPGGDRRGRHFLWLWTLTSLAGAAIGGYWWFHYYQQLVPPVAVATVLGLRAIPWGARHGGALLQRCAAIAGALALVSTLAIGSVLHADPVQLLVGYRSNTTTDFRPVAAYLREHTAPDEAIYVAYEAPAIYYLARRRPAGRWPDIPDLVRVPGAFREQVARLADPATAPRYIVAAQPFDAAGLDPEGAMRALIANDYRPETTIDGLTLYRRVR